MRGNWTEDSQPRQMVPNIAIPKQHYITPAVTLVIKKFQHLQTVALIPLIDRLLKYSVEQNSVGFWQSQQLFIDLKCQFKLEKSWKLFFCDMT